MVESGADKLTAQALLPQRGSPRHSNPLKSIGLAVLVLALVAGTLVVTPRSHVLGGLSLRPVKLEAGGSSEAIAVAPGSSAGGPEGNSLASGSKGDGGAAPAACPTQREPWHTPLSSWQDGEAFYAPLSRCTIHSDGSVSYDPTPAQASGMPFLFDVNQFAVKSYREHMCGVGIDKTRARYQCDGPCVFESRLCDTRYPGTYKSQAMLARYHAAGWDFSDLSPCEFFQRVRGRTLWFTGDSQTGHFYFAVECFLREFAVRWNRSTPFPTPINIQFNAHEPPIYPICFELLHNTRVCRLRVDFGQEMTEKIFPLMFQHKPTFANDIVLFNFGLHYGKLRVEGFLADISRIIRWRQERRPEQRPLMLWMDVPVKHFVPPTGKELLVKKDKGMECKNLTAWYEGDPIVLAGGKLNMAAWPHIPAMADAHLRTWNASVPLWDMHMPGECTHYCSPTGYHLWLYLLNRVLADSRVGTAVQALSVEEAERRAVAAAAAASVGNATTAASAAAEGTAGVPPKGNR